MLGVCEVELAFLEPGVESFVAEEGQCGDGGYLMNELR